MDSAHPTCTPTSYEIARALREAFPEEFLEEDYEWVEQSLDEYEDGQEQLLASLRYRARVSWSTYWRGWRRNLDGQWVT